MSDVKEVKPISSKGTTEERSRSENQMLAKVSFSWLPHFVDDQTSSDQSMGEDSDQAEYKPSCSKKLKSKKSRAGTGRSKKAVEKSEDVVQDQIILAPEIMCLILEQLDVRSLKQVRLVCKSWLHEAQTHMRRRAIIRFEREGCTARMTSFLNTLRTELPTLPNPFESIDLDFHTYTKNLGHKGLVTKVGSLRAPLVITRFNPAAVPMKVALPLILQWSSSLEYLKLVAVSCEADYLPQMDPEQSFPNLRHVHAEIPCIRTDEYPYYVRNTGVDWKHFPSIVAWIVNASPTLEEFESKNVGENELANELSWRVNIQNVKRLTLTHYRYNKPALENLVSIPFSRLENLKITCNSWAPPSVNEAVATALNNFANTLKTLNLHQNEKQLLDSFPICPDVYELSLSVLQKLNSLIPNPFPSLQVLNVDEFDVDVLGDLWRELPPFLGLKTLRAGICKLTKRCNYNGDELLIKFFEKFPSLERLQLNSEFLLRCCQLKATGDSRFSTMLEGVRHLEISEKYMFQREEENRDYSLLRFLKGIEVLTVIKSTETVVLIPFGEMPNLKVLEFPWVDFRGFYEYNRIPGLTRGLEKVFVTNCCSVRLRGGKDQSLKYRLKYFFESARNAECGCGRNPMKLSNSWM